MQKQNKNIFLTSKIELSSGVTQNFIPSQLSKVKAVLNSFQISIILYIGQVERYFR